MRRKIDIDQCGSKRAPIQGDKQRANRLDPTGPRENWSDEISPKYNPEWIDKTSEAETKDDDEQEQIHAGFE
jgi:hypothetical protein